MQCFSRCIHNSRPLRVAVLASAWICFLGKYAKLHPTLIKMFQLSNCYPSMLFFCLFVSFCFVFILLCICSGPPAAGAFPGTGQQGGAVQNQPSARGPQTAALTFTETVAPFCRTCARLYPPFSLTTPVSVSQLSEGGGGVAAGVAAGLTAGLAAVKSEK